MRVTVLNGSPKGNVSVTMQYVLYLRKTFPQHEFSIFNVSQEIHRLERDDSGFRAVVESVRTSDVVLWAFPLYVLLVPSQYKRFIELIWERDAQDCFRDKYAAVLTTSIHFYDHTAINYLNAICDDLEMRYFGSYPAHMYDLMHRDQRATFSQFAEHLFKAVDSGAPTVRRNPPVVRSSFTYVPGDVKSTADAAGKSVLVLTDSRGNDDNLRNMVDTFVKAFSGNAEVVNLHDLDINGGCLGCIQCGYDNQCAYGDKDGYRQFYNTKVRTADTLVQAGSITDRYLSARWKMFIDRSFFNGHTPSLAGKQVGIILSGPLGQNANLREVLEAHWETQIANLAGIVTDESEDSARIDALIQNMASSLAAYAAEGYMRPRTFLSVAGWKLFRDEIWSNLRLPFQADHRYYRRHGMYDFPQKQYKMRAINAAVEPLLRFPRVRRAFVSRTKEGMIAPLQKVLDSI